MHSCVLRVLLRFMIRADNKTNGSKANRTESNWAQHSYAAELARTCFSRVRRPEREQKTYACASSERQGARARGGGVNGIAADGNTAFVGYVTVALQKYETQVRAVLAAGTARHAQERDDDTPGAARMIRGARGSRSSRRASAVTRWPQRGALHRARVYPMRGSKNLLECATLELRVF